MRTLDGQKLNHGYGVNNEVLFKDESTEFANDGTQLVERCGLPDVYYAMIELLNLAGVIPNNVRENEKSLKTDEEELFSSNGSQIIMALKRLFANKLTEDARYDSIGGDTPADSNNKLRSAINDNYNSAEDSLTDSNNKLRSAITVIEDYLKNDLQQTIASKQNNLTAGTNIQINGSTISATDTIPNNATITIQRNGTKVDDFTANQSANKTINITVSKSDVGLGNVDNTSDANKPISTAAQTALNAKQASLSRTLTGNDNATGSVSDTGGDLSIPLPVTVAAPSASSIQTTAGTRSLRAQLNILIDNIAQLFTIVSGKQNSLNRTVSGDDNATGTITDTGGALTIPLSVTVDAPAASITQITAATRTLRDTLKILIDNIKFLFDSKASTGTSIAIANSDIIRQVTVNATGIPTVSVAETGTRTIEAEPSTTEITTKITTKTTFTLTMWITNIMWRINGLITQVGNKSNTDHKHAVSDITSGALALDRGGLGASYASRGQAAYGLFQTSMRTPSYIYVEGSDTDGNSGRAGYRSIENIKSDLGIISTQVFWGNYRKYSNPGTSYSSGVGDCTSYGTYISNGSGSWGSSIVIPYRNLANTTQYRITFGFASTSSDNASLNLSGITISILHNTIEDISTATAVDVFTGTVAVGTLCNITGNTSISVGRYIWIRYSGTSYVLEFRYKIEIS